MVTESLFRRRSWRLLLALLALAALAALAISLAAPEVRRRATLARFPRIVLVSIDTLNVDYVGAFNPEIDFTPELDRLARESVFFERAHTRMPITLPSHSSLFTGRSPVELGVLFNGFRLGEESETLPELLQGAGYTTAGFVSLGVLHGSSGLSQGFDTYLDEIQPAVNRWYLTADEVIAGVEGWLPSHAGEPFFLWVHLSDPHEPYQAKGAPPDVRVSLDGEPLGEWSLTSKETFTLSLDLAPGAHLLTWTPIREPRPDDIDLTSLRLNLKPGGELDDLLAEPGTGIPREVELRRPWSLELKIPGPANRQVRLPFSGWIASPPRSEVLESYRAEVGYTDRFLGRLRHLLEQERLEEGTVWVVVSDHGEGLFRHGARGHVIHSREDQLRILWMMKGPGLPAGRRVTDAGILMEDVAPTLLDLLGLRPPTGVSGVSQSGCWQARGCSGHSEWWALGARAEPLQVASVAGYRWPYKVLWDRKRGRTYLYDLEQDPFEQADLLERRREAGAELPEAASELRGQVRRRIEELEAEVARAAETPFDDQTLEALRDLGYLTP